MPPRTRTSKSKAAQTDGTPEFYEWDALVEEAHVDQKPFQIRVPVLPPEPDAKGKVPAVDPDADTHEMLTIPIPSGAAYINLVNSRNRGDMAGILVNLTTSTDTVEEGNELFMRLMGLMEKADFPIVDGLAAKVLLHYFNRAPKAVDGREGGAGE